MTKKSIITLCVALAAMLVIGAVLGILLSTKNKEYKDEQNASSLIVINEVSQSDVNEISFTWKDGESRGFIRTDGKWKSTDTQGEVDQSSVNLAVTYMSNVYAQSVISEDFGSLNAKDYSLDPPELTVKVIAGEKEYEYGFGCLSAAKDGIYFKSSTDNRLYLFSLENYNSILKGANALSDLTIDIDAANLTYIEFVRSTGVRTPVIMENENVLGTQVWEIKSPYTTYANTTLVSSVIGMFTPCSFHREIAKDDDGSYGFTEESGYILLKDASNKELKLLFGAVSDAENDRYYCKIDGEEKVYETFGGWSNLLKMDLENSIMSTPFPITDGNDVTVTLKYENNSYELKENSGKYTVNSVSVNEENALKIYSYLSTLSVKGALICENNLQQSVGEISFSKNGDTETYTMYLYKNGYIALSLDGGKTLAAYIDKANIDELKIAFGALINN